jgi:hypothetical protein
MPLNQIARRYADVRYGLDTEKAVEEHHEQLVEIRRDFNKRNMTASGSFIQALQVAQLNLLGNLAGAKMQILVDAFDKSGATLDDEIYKEIISEVRQVIDSQKGGITRSLLESAKRALGDPPENFESSIRNTVEHQAEVIYSKLNRELIVNVSAALLAGQRPASTAEVTVSPTVIKAGAVHDAYVTIRDIIKQATTAITIVDPYVGPDLWTMLTNLAPGIPVNILTRNMGADFLLEASKFSKQNAVSVLVRTTTSFHDRFVVLDNARVYHLGASIKDAGTKLFLISEIETGTVSTVLIAEINSEWSKATVVI